MMACPYCQGNATQEMDRVTALGYRLFRCRPCRRTFNERTDTPFNHLQVVRHEVAQLFVDIRRENQPSIPLLVPYQR